eukprot:c18724_g1_i1 orf=63-1832(+)
MWRLGVLIARAGRRGLRFTAHQQEGFTAHQQEGFIEAACKLLSSSRALQECTHHDDDDASSPPRRKPQQAREPTSSNKTLAPPQENIIKEGQIVNRDLSIAVLRSFVAKRQEELLLKEERKRLKIQNCDTTSINGEDLKQSDTEVKPEELCGINNTRKPFRVLEAAAASGLRAIRYALEVEGIDSVVALDKDKVAVEACERNIKLNGDAAPSKVQAELGDARIYMLTHEKEFDVVDIDPYGSPSIFLDSAVQCVTDGGLLMCTATDMAVLCGVYGEVCYTKYGSYSLQGKHCHEMAVRILLSSIESHANRYKRHIVPVLSISIDFYVRVFVRIYTSPISVKDSPSKMSYVYQCKGCDSFHLQPVGRRACKMNAGVSYMPGVGPSILPNCKECGKQWEVGGPIWSNPIHDAELVSLIHKDVTKSKNSFPAFDKVHGLLTAVSEELLDVPLFVNPHELSGTLKCVSPSNVLFFSALGNAGYRSSCCHSSPLALKTDAPMDVIWDIMRCWVKLHPIKAQPDGTIGSIILSKEPILQANFARVTKAERKAPTKRFPPNPEENWGPKTRAGRKVKLVDNNVKKRDRRVNAADEK